MFDACSNAQRNALQIVKLAHRKYKEFGEIND